MKNKPSVLRINMTGEKVGMLSVTGFAGLAGNGKHAVWACLCDCGRTLTVRGCDLRAGEKFSCGCTRRPPGFRQGRNYGLERLAKAIVEKRKEGHEPAKGKPIANQR
jgi:hypothetical protein